MRCPHCGNNEDKVLESRQNATGDVIRRRRECLQCRTRFTSYEQVQEKQLMVIKRDGRREPFDISKLERGINRSIEKRPIPIRVVEEMLQELEDEAMVAGRTTGEISTEQLGEMVLSKLYPVDRVAYVRFASVYRMFEDVEAFIKEIEKLTR
jgi:transcriptional repressor NrdR